MKKIEIAALLGTIIYIIAFLLQVATQTFHAHFINELNWSIANVALVSTSRVIALLFFHIVIAAWMARLAKRAERPMWVWIMFGIVFGLLAPILFFGMEIHEKLTAMEKGSEL